MRVLFDTNVILDVALNRKPFVDPARELWKAIEDGAVEGLIASFSFPTIFYVCRQQSDYARARNVIVACLERFEVCTVRRAEVEDAIAMQAADFEDCMQIATAVSHRVDCIASRDASGFKHSAITVFTPAELLVFINRR